MCVDDIAASFTNVFRDPASDDAIKTWLAAVLGDGEAICSEGFSDLAPFVETAENDFNAARAELAGEMRDHGFGSAHR